MHIAGLVLYKNVKLFSGETVLFYILTSNVWVIQLLQILASIWYCHYLLF